MSERIGPYELRGELGRGAMARVWRAWDPILEREVAVKEPLFDPSLSQVVIDEMSRRFVAEGRTAARLNHPGIVTIHTADVWDGRPGIVMELVEGATLSHLLEHGPLSPSEALSVLDQLLDAVGYAHARGVVHRDIKPDNMFISTEGRVKLADFGIAHVDAGATRATVAGAVLGTPGYMSPEQAKGTAVDARSDLFSIGVVAYEMLVGTNPFGSGDATTLLYRIVHEPAPELPESATAGLPADLRPAIMAALAKDPADRPQSAENMKRMLHGEVTALGDMGSLPHKRVAGSTGSSLLTQKVRPGWLPYALVGCGLVVVAGVMLAFALGGPGKSVGTDASGEASVEETLNAWQSESDALATGGGGEANNAVSELAVTGTTVSNLQRGGNIAQVGNMLYFTPDESYGGLPDNGCVTPKIYRAEINGAGAELIYDPKAASNDATTWVEIGYIQAMDNRLIFSRAYYDSSEENAPYTIRSISFDGSDERELTKMSYPSKNGRPPVVMPIQVYNNRIYFCDNEILYSMKSDGSDRTRVCDLTSASNWVICDDQVYYIEFNSSKTGTGTLIKAIALDGGSPETILNASSIYNFIPYGGCIYFMRTVNNSDSSGYTYQLGRFEIKSGEETILMETDSSSNNSMSGFTVDDRGVTASISPYQQSQEIYTAPIGSDTLTRIFTYDSSSFDSESNNVGKLSDARFIMYTALGDYIYFIPASYSIRNSTTDANELSSYVNSLCSIKRDGSDFTVITNRS